MALLAGEVVVRGKDSDQCQAFIVRHAGAGQIGDEVLQPLVVYDVLEALLLAAGAIQLENPD